MYHSTFAIYNSETGTSTVYEDQLHLEGDIVTPPSYTPPAGWKTDYTDWVDTESPWGPPVSPQPAKDKRYIIAIDPIKYKASYYNGTRLFREFADLRYGDAVPVPEDVPARISHTFDGWDPQPQGTMDEDKRFDAKWLHTPGHTVTVDYPDQPSDFQVTYDGVQDGQIVYDMSIVPRTGFAITGLQFQCPFPASGMSGYWAYYVQVFNEGGYKIAEDSRTSFSHISTDHVFTWDFSGESWIGDIKRIRLAANWNSHDTPDGFHDITLWYESVTHTADWYVDGSLYQSDEYLIGQRISVPTVEVPTGKSISAWSPVPPEQMPDEDLTFNATTSWIDYKARFYIDGSLYRELTLHYGDALQAPPYTPPRGSTLTPWSPSVPATMPARNFNTHASLVWIDYTARFYIDGSLYSEQTLHYGDPLQAPSYEEPGRTLTPWSPEVPATMPENDFSTYASVVWLDYTLTYMVDGSVYRTETHHYGDALTPVPVPEKQYYIAAGWMPEVPATMPASDLTVEAFYDTLHSSDVFDAVGDLPKFREKLHNSTEEKYRVGNLLDVAVGTETVTLMGEDGILWTVYPVYVITPDGRETGTRYYVRALPLPQEGTFVGIGGEFYQLTEQDDGRWTPSGNPLPAEPDVYYEIDPDDVIVDDGEYVEKLVPNDPGYTVLEGRTLTPTGDRWTRTAIMQDGQPVFLHTYLFDSETVPSYTVSTAVSPSEASSIRRIHLTVDDSEVNVPSSAQLYAKLFWPEGEEPDWPGIFALYIASGLDPKDADEWRITGFLNAPAVMPAADAYVAVTHDVLITADYVTVTFMDGSAVWSLVTGRPGQALEAPLVEPYREGYTFAGWSDVPSVYP